MGLQGHRANRPSFRFLLGLTALAAFLLAPLPEPHLPPKPLNLGNSSRDSDPATASSVGQGAGQAARDPAAVAPAARSILGDRSYRFEVRLDPRGGVRVDTLATLHPLPETMTFRLYRDDQTSKSITLQAISPPPGSTKVYQQPHYSGEYDPANGPYVAAEIQFPIGSGDVKTYRAKLAERAREEQR